MPNSSPVIKEAGHCCPTLLAPPPKRKGEGLLITDDIITILCEPEAKASYSPWWITVCLCPQELQKGKWWSVARQSPCWWSAQSAGMDSGDTYEEGKGMQTEAGFQRGRESGVGRRLRPCPILISASPLANLYQKLFASLQTSPQ